MNLKGMTICDSRGKESKTLFFVCITWFLLLAKFAVSGMTVGEVVMEPMDVMDFGIATTGILMIWIGREHTEKIKGKTNADT